ncbi:TonB-dependent receptor [Shewanella sp. 1_MG-2023]|uniref:TonB-dependent receptor n=1 Tax=unclassified Shewanella TaxID=196818 RepID=UPI0026E42745|nr:MULTISPECIES: TonB-dependent receptor [unclassified Shewanella]MDO6611640.1 TonB-dependent receptor [Shewanella sp. 7_MG-2023]MDO6771495.1 TonB-dependent receptor [Shewanella sp. 2_MG-2023]MDO6793856.1 TonB-dependent receptor [Shewanella sp. 1_MG-2023]
MKFRTFKKTRIATSLSVVLSASTMMPAFAADEAAADENIEVLQVTGIRGSLIKSMDLKRSSNGIVDAINAEDIGKFPDSNLAESLQRITGVSIDRQNGEGSRVSVRGFGADQNLVMLNNRQMPVTTGSRSFDFANIASEAISAVEVEKTSQAKNSTGGIGATINVLTHRPLSSPGLKATFGVKAVDDQSTDEGSVTPELSGLYSNTFADGKFGISISASYQERESGNQQAQVGTGWRSFPGIVDQDWGGDNAEWGGVPKDDNQINRAGEDDIYSVPQTTVYRFEEQQRTRTNGQLVLQYEPIDSLRATLDYTYMQNDVDTQSHDVSAWFNFVGTQESTWSDGPVSSPLVYSETYPDGGADLSMAAGDYGTRDESGSLGFNLEWDATDNLFLSLDYHTSEAERSPNSPNGSNSNLSTAAFIRTSAATDFTGDVPVLAVGGGNAVRPEDMRVTGSVFGNARNKSEVEQLQINGTYVFEEAGSIDFGIAATDVNNHSQEVNVQRNDWGGVGNAGDLDAAWFPAGSVQDKFDGSQGDFSDYEGSASIDPQDVIFLWDFEAVRARAAELYGSTAIGDCGNGFCPSTDYTTDRYTQEESQSAYVQYNYEGEWGDMPFDVHFGVRYEKTDVESTSRVLTYNEATWIAETEVALGSTATDNSAFQTETGEYDYFLPSFNFNIEVIEDVYVRAAYSETIGRPDYTSIQGGTSIGELANRGGGSGNTGTPGLLPLESTNYDLSTEWYYDDASYVSVGYFRKDVTNFIDSNSVNSNLYNIPDPTQGAYVQEAIAAGEVEAVDQRNWIYTNYNSIDGLLGQDPNVTRNADNGNIEITGGAGDPDLIFNIATPSNSSDSSVIDGWEFAVQHFFGESGFGMQANYTIVNAGDSYDNFNLNRPGYAEQNVLTNISDTANVVAMYENYGFSARLAWNWRDEFLNSTGDGTGANPSYTEEYSQVDFNIGYDVAAVEGLTVFFEGLNITEENTRTHGRSYSQVLNYTQTGARYSLGARYTF